MVLIQEPYISNPLANKVKTTSQIYTRHTTQQLKIARLEGSIVSFFVKLINTQLLKLDNIGLTFQEQQK
jgi:hypothetical protein